ncbi:NAD(P)H-binding protein [Janthinobacterium sp.]|uniref:NmrA family NAD(P)-binding protein n=1 Tax=Janthinobacterium sp. TaxID=1871054 RepID=UPI00293D8B33|nr:NAD(P)H-binding protein [Janthinobacterium sp.]
MIVITAPTSTIGSQVLETLVSSGERVRVIARDPARLPTHMRERIEVLQGSHSDINIVNQAFEGADAVFWLVPPDPQAKTLEAAYVDFTRPACAAFKSQAMNRVVGISALGRGTTIAAHAGLVTASLAMDDLIANSGVNYRALTMPSFMDNIIRQVVPIKTQGMFFSPISGDRKMPACATRDIAASAVRLLRDATWSGPGQLAVLGPEDISFNDMAKVISDVLGKPVRYQQISFETYKSWFTGFGMSEAMAQGMTDMASAKNDGLDNAESRAPDNTTPTSFRQWCEEILKPAVLG